MQKRPVYKPKNGVLRLPRAVPCQLTMTEKATKSLQKDLDKNTGYQVCSKGEKNVSHQTKISSLADSNAPISLTSFLLRETGKNTLRST